MKKIASLTARAASLGLIGALAASMAAAGAGSAMGAPPPAPGVHVLIVGPSSDDPTVARIRQELQILGFDVEFVARAPSPAGTATGAPPANPSLSELARGRGAIAAASVEQHPPGILLWTDPQRFPSVSEDPMISVGPGNAGSSEPAMIALRAIELLRGRLLHIRDAEAADSGASSPALDAAPTDAAPPADAMAPLPAPILASAPPLGDAGIAEPTPPRAGPLEAPKPLDTTLRDRVGRPSLFLGPAIVAGSGGFGVTPNVWLGGRWGPISRLDVEILAILPTTPATITVPEGRLALRVGALGLGANGRFTDPAWAFFVTGGLGIGALAAFYAGDATSPWRSAGGVGVTAFPYARLGAGYWVNPRVATRLDLLAGLARPQPVIRSSGRDVATFGDPALLLAIGIEVRP